MGGQRRVGLSAAALCLLSVTLLVLALLSSPSGAAATAASIADLRPACDRVRSRTARAILEQYVYPLSKRRKYSPSPSSCPFFPEGAADVFAAHDAARAEVRRGHWRCGLCGKAFRGSEYLDRHFDNRHADSIPANATVCLADYCDILHCDEYEQGAAALRKCDARKMESVRHRCEVVSHTCFPVDAGKDARLLADAFTKRFCDTHACNRKQPAVVKKPDNGAERVLYMMAVITMFILLAGLYLGVWLYRSDLVTGRGDLKRLRRSNNAFIASLWGARKQKQY
eukprot:jgi/Chlat1/5596/Chrsp369S08999